MKKNFKKIVKTIKPYTSYVFGFLKIAVILAPTAGAVFLANQYQASFYMIIGLILTLILAIILAPSIFTQLRKNKPTLKEILSSPRKLTKFLTSQFKNCRFFHKKNKQPTKKQNIIWSVAVTALILAVAITVFTLITLKDLPSVIAGHQQPILNLILSYYLSWKAYFSQSVSAFVSGSILTIFGIALLSGLGLLIRAKFSKAYQPSAYLKRLFFTPFLVLIATAVGFHLTLVLVLGIRSYQFKQFAQQLSSDPNSAGITTDPEQIKEKIEELSDQTVLIQQFNPDQTYELAIELNTQPNRGRFYNNFLANNIPEFYRPQIQLPEAELLYANQQLLISEIDQDQFQVISPELGEHLVSQYFTGHNIKHKPENLEVINRQDYLDFRDEQINQEIEKIDEEIASKRSQIGAKQAAMQNVLIQFIRGELSYDQARSRYFGYQDQIDILRSEIAELQEIKELIASQKDQAPHELGLYMPKDNQIKVVLDKTSSDALTEYLAILVHEYLHYTSYVNDERYLPVFFEEGLTEYFTRDLLKEELGLEAHVGYPIIVRAVGSLVRDIDRDQLLKVYFTKDADLLASLLNEKHGDSFYEDSLIHFITIQYSSFEESLDLANDLIEETGGEPMTKEEIIDEYTQEQQEEIEKEAQETEEE